MKHPNVNLTVLDRLAALSDPIRLRVLRLLESEELSVGEVARVLQLPQSTVSRHLKVLGEGGWLVRRQLGTASYYRVVLDDLSSDERALWVTVRGQLGEAPELAEDARRVEAVIAERATDSVSFFGRIAGGWDALRSELFGNHFTAQALLTMLPRDWVVADVGCGTGNVAELVAPCVNEVVAIDQSAPMLEAAERRLGGAKNVRFVQGSVETLPLDDGSVDAIVCVLVLHHVEEPVAAMREMARVLRSDRGGGVALVVDMLEHGRVEYKHTMGHKHLGFSESGLAEMFEGAGFAAPEVRTIRGESQAKGPGLFAAVGRVRGERRKK
ncbi:MAG: metalloregulator ArsR/SmtB family transcription factor [Phycisphaerales bacterium]